MDCCIVAEDFQKIIGTEKGIPKNKRAFSGGQKKKGQCTLYFVINKMQQAPLSGRRFNLYRTNL